jgi:hypothetical protein
MATTRSIEGETTLTQGSIEEITYTLDVTKCQPSTTAPTTPTMVIEDAWVNGTDVSLTVLSGAMSVSGQVITLQEIAGLTAGTTYRVMVRFDKTGVADPYEVVFWIYCDD